VRETIDSHHHHWKYNPREYGWITERMKAIQRDFLPSDLELQMRSAGIHGTVLVQARQTLQETEWNLTLAEENPFIRGVVGWVPLIDKAVERELMKLSNHAKLKAVRHVLHDEADDFYMLRRDFNEGIQLLATFNLAYDLLIFERHLPQAIQLVDRHPGVTFVLDHIAKPRIREHVLSPWRENIIELGRRQNVFCKVSGMVTEADWQNWKPTDLRPYFDAVLERFGPRRLMFGSDWPVLLLACSYERWAEIVTGLIFELTDEEKSWIMGAAAAHAYRLPEAHTPLH
jgi:L-fuconolactonase